MSTKTFFYSEAIQKWVAYGPLKVDERVLKAAKQHNIEIDWDEEGNVCNISFLNAQKLLKALDSYMLSPVEYWQVLEEASRLSDSLRVRALTADEFGEWLDVLFYKNEHGELTMYLHPEIKLKDTEVQVLSFGNAIS